VAGGTHDGHSDPHAQQAGGLIGAMVAQLKSCSRFTADHTSAAPIWNAAHDAVPAPESVLRTVH
jgi:hypothetical protein